MNMAPPCLSNMPPEILINIFRYAPSVSAASALSQTSSALHDVWTANIPRICDATLERGIECYKEANELFEAQEETDPVLEALQKRLRSISKSRRRNLPENQYLARVSVVTQKAIEKTRRMLANAKMMESVLGRFDVDELCSPTQHNIKLTRDLTSKERERFIKAYYRVTCITTLADHVHPARHLASLNRFEIFQMDQVMSFMWDSKTPLPMLKVGNYPISRRRPMERYYEKWSYIETILGGISRKIRRLDINRLLRAQPKELRMRYDFIRDGEWEAEQKEEEQPLSILSKDTFW
ncbi:hypothetical protein ACLMJK_006058 [Lecanora helva]